jgi:hypothetical protein
MCEGERGSWKDVTRGGVHGLSVGLVYLVIKLVFRNNLDWQHTCKEGSLKKFYANSFLPEIGMDSSSITKTENDFVAQSSLI